MKIVKAMHKSRDHQTPVQSGRAQRHKVQPINEADGNRVPPRRLDVRPADGPEANQVPPRRRVVRPADGPEANQVPPGRRVVRPADGPEANQVPPGRRVVRPADGPEANRVPPGRRVVRPADSAEANWVPPVYSDSQSCEPDLVTMEKNRCVCFMEDAPELDYYKMLRTQIMQRTKAKGRNTVMITSALPGEGKTVTSINLAMTFAKAYNQTALLVDSDLRQQKVYYYMGIDSRLGIFDHLVEGRPLKDIIIWPRIEKMTLISGGRIINESAELLGSPKMKFLIEEMKTRYKDRFILFDAPPVLSGADALILSSLVDGIIMVVEADKTPLNDIQEALTLMPKEKFLGFVLNKHTSERKGYYNYNYRSAKEKSKRR